MTTPKMIDVSIDDVINAYSGPVGTLWELLMGEEIHVGGAEDTDILARLAGFRNHIHVLDICSALGGPARHLAKNYGCRVTGIDATQAMVTEAKKRTSAAGLSDRVDFRLGNALDLPFRASTFDIVWGQDAWCYVTDKERLIKEGGRVIKPGGTLAFTDWIETGNMTDEERERLLSFMIFPDLETPDGYSDLLVQNGWEVTTTSDLSGDFARYCTHYLGKLRNDLKDVIVGKFGSELYEAAEQGLTLWEKAAREGKVGRGRWIAQRT